MSKLSFQYGLSVFLIGCVVLVCSPSTVTTAKGSGAPIRPSELKELESLHFAATYEVDRACRVHRQR